MFKVPKKWIMYTKEPEDSMQYTKKMDRIYARFAKAYDGFIKVFPLWMKWLRAVLPYAQGRILEVSFGPASLMSELPNKYKIHGLDFNVTMVKRARRKMKERGKNVKLIRGNVESMPYPDHVFNTVINTMAFSGYPNGRKAMGEMLRVLKPGGLLLILDYDYPANRNIFGYLMVKLIEVSGDIIRDIEAIAMECGCECIRKPVGGFGSVQLFVIQKNEL
jgi:ubiquinone/menaquinone biosynthesis C-methylase UbiE